MVDFYVREYGRHGLHGPTNWYRTRRRNFEDELPRFVPREQGAVPRGRVAVQVPGHGGHGREGYHAAARAGGWHGEVVRGPRRATKGGRQGVGHWGMWQDPETVNGYIGSFVEDVLGGRLKGKL
ncbi:hypothetical protein PG997_012223 [Apiospora hydei]|uniref:Uncharacterized protein n=1 Tax=Apiospora hydei TaxID=1337664 RepID=A0ABR1V2R3_9PEZI